jgi:hypothetical protein
MQELGITLLVDTLKENYYDAVILAVAHRQFAELNATGVRALGKSECIVYDSNTFYLRMRWTVLANSESYYSYNTSSLHEDNGHWKCWLYWRRPN